MLHVPLLLYALAQPIPAPPLVAPDPPARGVVDELEEAERKFRDGLRSRDLDAKKAGLQALAATGNPKVTPLLISEFAALTALRKARDEVYVLGHRVGHKERLIADLKLRAERDETLIKVLKGQEVDLEGIRRELGVKQEAVEREVPWRDALTDGTRSFFGALDRGKRRSAEKQLWKDAEEHAQLEVRLGAIEILGLVGETGTAVGLQKLLTKIAAERVKLGRQLPKAEQEVRKMEQRMQKEAEQSGGGMSGATAQQYARKKQEAAAMRTLLTLTGYLADACVYAAGSALGREVGDERAKAIQAIERSLRKAGHGARLRTLHILAQVPDDDVRASMRGLLAAEKDAASIARLLEDLSVLGDQAIVSDLIAIYLVHESWHVQSHAVAALAKLRSKEAIGVLIDRIETAEGRVRTDVRHALVSLTGQDYRTNVELWRRWWKAEEATFVVPAESEVEAQVSEEAKRQVGVTFFGIQTESQRVLFVLDLSGSMNFSMVPRDNPTDDANRPFDMPRSGESSRLTVAKRELVKALGGLEDGALFNLVLYASDVWPMRDKLMTMEEDARAEVLERVDEFQAVGGTNIYGALQAALELAGVDDDDDEWSAPEIDTIFLLSDGRPSVGVTTDPEEILAFVEEKNASAGIVIHTIGLSGAQDAYFLQELAERNGGTYAAQ